METVSKAIWNFCVMGTLIVFLFGENIYAQEEWKGKWISIGNLPSDPTNLWLGFQKDFYLEQKLNAAVAKIAVDSKYWLYVNDKMVVFEGGLKRGPNRNDTYYDEVDLSPYLRKGKNTISIKVWYFGKHGFSHNSSGRAGLLFDLQTPDFDLVSDGTWFVRRLSEYQTAPGSIPNFRLSESNILYDARIADPFWYKSGKMSVGFSGATVYGAAGSPPWNNLVQRPIPLWKDFGLKEFSSEHIARHGDTVVCKLPYNMQFTPYLEIDAAEGDTIELFTDNYLVYNGSTENIRAAYVTKDGYQDYESPGWMNGHVMYYVLPKGVTVHRLGYRETGYDTEFSGYFSCSDTFFNKLWEKARRTLYITMRDTYMDCPDRERAQWTGDAVLEAEEAFYTLDTSSHALTRKWLYELVNWQKEDGSMYSPIPSGNWNKELPDQVLASIGYYGIWIYYMHTGDKRLLADLYPKIQRYFDLWEFDEHGLIKVRTGGWLWGDWGDNKDILPLFNLWYYLGLKGNYLMATELGHRDDAVGIKQKMDRMKASFNKFFWNNGQYRDPNYQGKTDDRIHALAVLSGIADPDKYADIERVFDQQEHASPYMEKYVYEAMYKMRLPAKANARHKRRFGPMVNHPYFTTLFEGWEIGSAKYGGGTVNHAWSGGGLTVLSAYMAGIRPVEAGYKTFLVDCQLGDLADVRVVVPSVKGNINAAIQQRDSRLSIRIKVPVGTQAKVRLPDKKITHLVVNGDVLVYNGEFRSVGKYQLDTTELTLPSGTWSMDVDVK